MQSGQVIMGSSSVTRNTTLSTHANVQGQTDLISRIGQLNVCVEAVEDEQKPHDCLMNSVANEAYLELCVQVPRALAMLQWVER